MGARAPPERLTVLIVTIVAGAVIGLSMGTLGGGGSILAVPVLVYALLLDPQEATTASLVIVGVTAIVAAVSHARAGHVDWRAALVVGALGVPASVGGTLLNRVVDPQVLLLAFAALMLLAAVAMYRRSRGGQVGTAGPATPVAPATAGAHHLTRVVGVALAVGFLTGFLGVGGGFLIVPALVLAMGFGMPTAVGTSLVVISVTSLAAFVERLGHGGIPWAVVLPFTIAAVVASLLGKRLSERVSGTTLARAFAVMLVLVAGYVGVRAGSQLLEPPHSAASVRVTDAPGEHLRR